MESKVKRQSRVTEKGRLKQGRKCPDASLFPDLGQGSLAHLCSSPLTPGLEDSVSLAWFLSCMSSD